MTCSDRKNIEKKVCVCVCLCVYVLDQFYDLPRSKKKVNVTKNLKFKIFKIHKINRGASEINLGTLKQL